MNAPGPSAQLIHRSLFATLLAKAGDAPRQRVNHNFHATLEDNPHRFLNVMLRDSYFTPHRHLHPPKAESFLVLEGELALFIFEEDGKIRECHLIGRDLPAQGIDIAPGLWHTLLVLSDHCICFEVKPGPYKQSTDKEFAPWAPAEGSADCGAYMDRLRRHIDSDLAATT